MLRTSRYIFLNKRVNDEVSGESAPFIYERIGSRYHNYLIDEFQDTSKMQWLNFLPLLDEAMTHDFGSDTVEVGTQSLVVGDGKQAIYRFRQGDVRQFIKLPNVDSTVHGLSLKHNARVDTLRDNHRTLGNIVRFNNRFFRKIIGGSFADNPWLTSLYRGDAVGEHDEWELDQHEIFEGGYMQIGFYDEDEMCEAVLRAIRRQVDEFHYGYGDIMVLARYKKTLVQIGNYLTDNAGDSPIPIVSSESFVLSNSRVVLLLQALLQYIYDDKNRLAAYQVSRLTDELDLHVPDISSLNTGLLRSLSLYDCCEELLRLFHLQGMDSAYVSTFLNVVDKYTRNINADLASFNDYLAKNISNLSSTTVSDMQAVQLMTIHKAKGLEAKIVIYVIPEMTGRPQSMWVNVPAEDGEGLPVAYVTSNKERKTAFSDIFKEEELMTQMDRINLLYVAMTRPEHKMYVVCQERNAYDGIDNVSLLHRFVEKDKDCRTEDNVVFEVGEDTMNLAVSSKKKKTAYVVENVSFPTWEDKICIAEQHESQFFDASLFGRPSEDELEDKRLYGILVHDLLSRIMTEADVEPVVNRYCAERHWSESDAAAIRERILRMIHKAENRRFFESGNRVMCEYSLVVNGEVRRPDRIVFSSDETWVVDFKTGRFNKKSHERYLNQVNTYASALTAMGYPNVQSSILYL